MQDGFANGDLGSVIGQQAQEDNAISAIAKGKDGNAFMVWNNGGYNDKTL